MQIEDLGHEVADLKVYLKASLEEVETEFSFTLYFTARPENKIVEDNSMPLVANSTSSNSTETTSISAPEIELSTFDTIAANLTERHPQSEEL